MIAAEVALAFNGINERKAWSARPHASDGREVVHFTAPANLVTIVLECDTGAFQVRFNKTHAAWGDYIRSIARSLYVVQSTLKQAGLPFDTPDTIEGTEIITTVGDGVIYVRAPTAAPLTPVTAVMPELRPEPSLTPDEEAIARGLLSDAAIVT